MGTVNKIKTINALRKIITNLRKNKKTIVFTNGCFDLFHIGHVDLLEKARRLGDCLVVGINSDSSVKRLKGNKRPIVPQYFRARIVASLSAVDYVTIFEEDTPFNVINKIKPDILVKGGDYEINQIVGREIVKKVVRIPLVKGQSTTSLISTILKRYGQSKKRR